MKVKLFSEETDKGLVLIDFGQLGVVHVGCKRDLGTISEWIWGRRIEDRENGCGWKSWNTSFIPGSCLFQLVVEKDAKSLINKVAYKRSIESFSCGTYVIEEQSEATAESGYCFFILGTKSLKNAFDVSNFYSLFHALLLGSLNC